MSNHTGPTLSFKDLFIGPWTNHQNFWKRLSEAPTDLHKKLLNQAILFLIVTIALSGVGIQLKIIGGFGRAEPTIGWQESIFYFGSYSISVVLASIVNGLIIGLQVGTARLISQGIRRFPFGSVCAAFLVPIILINHISILILPLSLIGKNQIVAVNIIINIIISSAIFIYCERCGNDKNQRAKQLIFSTFPFSIGWCILPFIVHTWALAFGAVGLGRLLTIGKTSLGLLDRLF